MRPRVADGRPANGTELTTRVAYGLKTQGATIAWVAVAGVLVCVVIAFVIRAKAGNSEFFTSRGGKDTDVAKELELDATGN
jgi:hypothetical protein